MVKTKKNGKMSKAAKVNESRKLSYTWHHLVARINSKKETKD